MLSQISVFLRKYTPALEAQLREARTRLRAMFPRGFELVYDNYTLWCSASAQLSVHPTRSFPWPAIRGGSRSSSSMAHTYATRTVSSKVKASKSGASDSRNPKTSTHPRLKRSLHKPFFPMSRRFLLLRASPPSSSRCQPSSGHDARENDAQRFHRAETSKRRLACRCRSYQRSIDWTLLVLTFDEEKNGISTAPKTIQSNVNFVLT